MTVKVNGEQMRFAAQGFLFSRGHLQLAKEEQEEQLLAWSDIFALHVDKSGKLIFNRILKIHSFILKLTNTHTYFLNPRFSKSISACGPLFSFTIKEQMLNCLQQNCTCPSSY